MLGLLYIQRLSARNPTFTHSLSSKELFLASMVRPIVLAVAMGNHCLTACTSTVWRWWMCVCCEWVYTFRSEGEVVKLNACVLCMHLSCYLFLCNFMDGLFVWCACNSSNFVSASSPQWHAPAVVLTSCSHLPTPDCGQQVLERRRRT